MVHSLRICNNSFSSSLNFIIKYIKNEEVDNSVGQYMDIQRLALEYEVQLTSKMKEETITMPFLHNVLHCSVHTLERVTVS